MKPQYLIQVNGAWKLVHRVQPDKYSMTGRDIWSDIETTAYICRVGEESFLCRLAAPKPSTMGVLETGFSRPTIHNVSGVHAAMTGHSVSLFLQQEELVGPCAVIDIFFKNQELADNFNEAIADMRHPVEEYPGEVTDPAGTSGPGYDDLSPGTIPVAQEPLSDADKAVLEEYLGNDRRKYETPAIVQKGLLTAAPIPVGEPAPYNITKMDAPPDGSLPPDFSADWSTAPRDGRWVRLLSPGGSFAQVMRWDATLLRWRDAEGHRSMTDLDASGWGPHYPPGSTVRMGPGPGALVINDGPTLETLRRDGFGDIIDSFPRIETVSGTVLKDDREHAISAELGHKP